MCDNTLGRVHFNCSGLSHWQGCEEGNHLQTQLPGEAWLGERTSVKRLFYPPQVVNLSSCQMASITFLKCKWSATHFVLNIRSCVMSKRWPTPCHLNMSLPPHSVINDGASSPSLIPISDFLPMHPPFTKKSRGKPPPRHKETQLLWTFFQYLSGFCFFCLQSSPLIHYIIYIYPWNESIRGIVIKDHFFWLLKLCHSQSWHPPSSLKNALPLPKCCLHKFPHIDHVHCLISPNSTNPCTLWDITASVCFGLSDVWMNEVYHALVLFEQDRSMPRLSHQSSCVLQ